PNGGWLVGCVGLFGVLIGRLTWTADDSLGGLIGLAILKCIALALGVGVVARYLFRDIELPRITVRGVVLTGCVAIAATATYSVFVMLSAQTSAQQIASGKPYCIQVATRGSDYRTLRSRIDLAGFYMMGDRGVNHAVLAVRESGQLDLYHWSYRLNRFES